jgi:hypothetical protein
MRLRIVLTIAAVLTSVMRSLAQDRTDALPVLTVCEALRNLKAYGDTDVVIVGRSVFTFEGTFLNEDCALDGKILIQGQRWSSRILRGGDGCPPFNKKGPNVDEDLLRRKLLQVKETTSLKSGEELRRERNPFADYWAAVVGRLVSPPVLIPHRPPSEAQPKNRPGNGYGANGSVPAAIICGREYKVWAQP